MPYTNLKDKLLNNKTWRQSEKGKVYYRKWSKEWYKNHPGCYKKSHYMRSYHLTLEQLEQMKQKQSFKCLICNLVKPLCVDHDHITGVIRGLLCKHCNLKLGWFEKHKGAINAIII